MLLPGITSVIKYFHVVFSYLLQSAVEDGIVFEKKSLGSGRGTRCGPLAVG